ncbi:enoyl-CoA hydratase/isomerase family protein [Reichenbachiella agarivorans]|uniref:Enoyl-CoA hydratase/isomerase family protein n=1 Tax=Reichenbachiella agarivorans TaxID=2979464 RepID=A0ABY6CK20_9BACT|nr:enoyl-CoA hydratase/isomerase family protein [Reichenbachiella agarivorans]UXP30875.1 enoyl-CoA hydratase/isomerase family protein [Reichenbachiella agarivorans]
MSGKIEHTHDHGVATITFYHPKSNSLPSNLLKQLQQSIEQLSDNPSVKVIVLQSTGNVFCAGASFDELLLITNEAEGKDFFMGFANVINTMRNSSKLIITKVHGKAVGGGVGLACATDYCVALDSASIKLSELSIGIGPFVIEPAVVRRIGLSAFSQLTLNPTTWKDAKWAQSMGMYLEVFATQSEMDLRITELSRRLSTYSQEAISEIKKVLWNNCKNWTQLLEERAKISGKLVLSPTTQTALNAFRNK